MINRRSFLLGSVSFATISGSPASVFAQSPSGADAFRQQYGANFHSDLETLKFLKQVQEFGTLAPRDINLYNIYLDNLPLMRKITTGGGSELYHLMLWHAFALELTALDHTTIQANPNDPPDLLFAEQYGPCRTSRALAIIHIALFEAVNAIYRHAQSYNGIQEGIFADTGLAPAQVTPLTASVKGAVAAAAYGTMVVLYPHKRAFTQAVLDKLSSRDPENAQTRRIGNAIGAAAAKQILILRKYDFNTFQFGDGSQSDGSGGIKFRGPNDNSLSLEPEFNDLYHSPGVRDWQVEPIHPTAATALGGYWSFVDPFVLDPDEMFLPPGPPATGSVAFSQAYAATRSLGGDPYPLAIGDRYPTPTTRTGTLPGSPLDASNETFKGIFWGYDGTNLLCAPPRLYNMVATSVALDEFPITDVADMARYLALINMTLADAGIAGWTAKYYYHFARPVTYIRQTLPDQIVNGSPNRHWTPLGAPITNGTPIGTNTTPPFPSYPSGHATFGGSLFMAMRLLLPVQSDAETAFRFVSDEFNGRNRDPTGVIMPFVERHFPSFEAAEVENAQSRIWLGIHWQFDADDGRALGHQVADYVVGHALQKV